MAKRNQQFSLKPQDLLVCLKVAGDQMASPSYAALAEALGISTSEAHACVARLVQARLLKSDDEGIRPNRASVTEFVISGAPYAFPAVTGAPTRGMPTGYAAAPLRDLINQPEELPPVWPDSSGNIRGVALFPLYPSVPKAARKDPLLYEILALFDALRSGAAREREIAEQLLRERI